MMVKTITLPNLTRAIILIFAGIILSFFLSTKVFSQDASPSASTTGEIKFPVGELGGCTSLETCTNFCEDPVNYNSCTSFAKTHGFYKDDQTLYGDDTFWEKTQNDLGCNSEESCADLCAKTENFDKCSSYASSNNIPGGYTDDPAKTEVIEAAKTSLGCDSPDSCVNVCNDPANAQKCTDFANQVGLQGGNVSEGPGGCQTPGTCGAYCSDPANYDQCKAETAGGNFTGPGSCTSEATCTNFCEQNSDQCRSYEPGSNGVYVPIECASGEFHGPGGTCTAVGDTKKAGDCVGANKFWDGNSCADNAPVGISTEVTNAHFEAHPELGGCTTPGECFDTCKADPAKCPGFDANVQRPTDEYNPYVYYTPGTEVKHEPIETMGGCTSPAGCYDYCKENPGKCNGFSASAPRPPENYIPGTYYTPPANIAYVTPPTTNFYTTPVYYTPPTGSNYTTPQYYTPGMYSTPSYQTPSSGSNYSTPTYYTPGSRYPTPTGAYPTPSYVTPTYYTPPAGSNYTTPYYYTPAQYTTPYYYTPSGSYTTPTYSTPAAYTTPQYFTPYTGTNYTTPHYYTPISYTTPYYYTPPVGSTYTSPSYYTPPTAYTSPTYYTPGQYPTPITYTSPAAYTSPVYYTPPAGSSYTSPTYYTPGTYPTPIYYTPPAYTTPYGTPSGSYYYYPSPGTGYSYPTPGYAYPTPGSGYTSPTYLYPSPSSGSYAYPTPGGVYDYPTPGSGYAYPTPATYYTPGGSYTYPSPSYSTPSYGTPEYPTPSYSYPSPSYGTPTYGYPTPGEVHGIQTVRTIFDWLRGLFK